MQTVQLPFFLNSGQGKNRSSTGHSFDVELSPPIVVPKNAREGKCAVKVLSKRSLFTHESRIQNLESEL